MTVAIVFADGEDFSFIEDDFSSGSIMVDSIDSGRNWSIYMTGLRPVENGILSKDCFFRDGDVVEDYRDYVNMNMVRSDYNTSLIQEDVAEDYSVGSFYVPGTYPDIQVDFCVTDSFEDFPPVVEDAKVLKKEDKDALDLDLFNLVSNVRKRTLEAVEESCSKDLDVVFVYLGFPDLLHHVHCRGVSDQLLETVFEKYDSEFDEVLMISDHQVRTKSRTIVGKHQTPAKYISTWDELGGEVQPLEVYGMIEDIIYENTEV